MEIKRKTLNIVFNPNYERNFTISMILQNKTKLCYRFINQQNKNKNTNKNKIIVANKKIKNKKAN